jgi:translocation and assembly module TamB
MNWNVIIQKTIRWTAVSVAILIILPSILFGLAQTEIGKRQVARQFVERLGLAGKARIQVGKIEGVIPFDFRMDRLVSSDADGEVLTVEDLCLRGSPVALLWGRFRVKELSASLLQLNRLPSEDKSVETKPKKLPEWPSALNRLSIERFAIDRLILGREVLGQKAVFRLEARLRALNAFAEQNAEIHLNRIDGPMAEATVNVGVKHRGTSLRLHAKVDEAEGGVLAGFLRIPGPTILSLEGAGPLKNWRGNLKVAIGGLGELETSLSLETLDVPKLKAEGKMRVHSGRSPARLRRLLSDETRFAMTLRMPHKQSIEVDHLNLDGHKTSLRLKGAVDF